MKPARRTFDATSQPLRGVHVIEASAGTGKTHSITLLWLRLLVERQLRVDQILVTTFTRAAAAELRDRLLASLRRALAAVRHQGHPDEPEAEIMLRAQELQPSEQLEARLQRALSSFDLAPVHTIHGFCESLINRHALELGCDPDLSLVDDASPILRELVDDRLMRDAARTLLDPTLALRVASVAAANPLAVLLEPVSPEWVTERSRQLILPMVDRVGTLAIPSRSLSSIQRKLLELIESGKWEAFRPPQKEYLGPLMGELSSRIKAVRDLHRALGAARLAPIARAVQKEYRARKAAARLRTFDDILLTVHRGLSTSEDGSLERSVRERYRAAIVDECQDCDTIQIEVFRLLFSHTDSFLVIGDPKQSIYRFRGADLQSYQLLAEGTQSAGELTTNYRSDAALVDALNRLYAPHPEFHGPSGEAPYRYVEVSAAAPPSRINDARAIGPLFLLYSDAGERHLAKRELARQLAVEFRRLLDERVTIVDRFTNRERPLVASDLAVLATSHADLGIVRRALVGQDIPCEQVGASLGSVYLSDEALDISTWFAAVQALTERTEPLAAMLAFAACPLIGMAPDELVRFRQDEALQIALAESLLSDFERLPFIGPLPLLRRYWDDPQGIGARLGGRDGERRMANWRQLGCLLQAEWAAGRAGWNELSQWLDRRRADPPGEGAGALMKLETDRPAAQLATVFAAKGLEYPVVGCPFLWHRRSHQPRSQGVAAVLRTEAGIVLDVGSPDFVAHCDRVQALDDDEQERILYVALTRARHRVYLGLAPVEASRGHDNAARDSVLVRLLGLDQTPSDQWPRLSPISPLRLRPQATPVARDGQDAAAPMQLAKPLEIELHRGPLLRCTSYSALTRGEELAARDHDPSVDPEASPAWGLLEGLGLTGNRLGQKVHRLLEEVVGNGCPLQHVVANLPPAWESTLSTILSTPIELDGQRVTLSLLHPTAITEMHALLPLRTVTPVGLSQALLADPLIAGEPKRRAWAEAIARFGFGTLAGFFQGYIDLIFRHNERFYIVDYKTNALVGYDPASLEAAMLQHHYLLQARLYTVALHRHLAATLDGYEPERHLGGCAYLFLRGFPSRGTWFERMGPDAVDALSSLFAQGAA